VTSGRRQERAVRIQGRICEFVELLNKTKEPIHDKSLRLPRRLHRLGCRVVVDLALQWNSTYAERDLPYTNNVHNKDGGTHLTGFGPRSPAP